MATPKKRKGLIEEMEEERQKERKEPLNKLNQLAKKYPKFRDKLSNMKNDGVIDDMSVKQLDKLYEKELKKLTKSSSKKKIKKQQKEENKKNEKKVTKPPSKKEIEKQKKEEAKESEKKEMLNKLNKLVETNPKFKDELNNAINDGVGEKIESLKKLYNKELSHRPTTLTTINKEEWSIAHPERIDQLGKTSMKKVKDMLISRLKKMKLEKNKLQEAETKTNDQLQEMVINLKKDNLNKKYPNDKKIVEEELKDFKDKLQKSRENIDIFLTHSKSNGVPLHHAIEFKASLKIIKQIYDKSKEAIKVRKTISREIPLHRAAYLDSVDVIPFLLTQYPEGAGLKNKATKTALDIANERNKTKSAKLLEKVTEQETKKLDEKLKLNTKPEIIEKLRTYKKYKLKTKRKGLKKETLPDEYKLEEKSLDELKKMLEDIDKQEEEEKDIKKSKRFSDRFLPEKTRKEKQAQRLKNIKTKKKKLEASRGRKTKNAVTALKRYMGLKKSSGKKGEKKKKKKKKEKKEEQEIDPETLLKMRKLEKARELLKITSDVYGITSSEYDEVEDYALNWTKKKRMGLDEKIVPGFETKKDLKTKERVIQLLDDYDNFISDLKKADSYAIYLEEMGKKAKKRLMGMLKGVSMPSTSGMMDGDGIIPMMVNVAKIIGVNALEFFRFTARHGIDIAKIIHVPVRYSIRKNRPRLIRRSMTNRVKNKLYNLQKYDSSKDTDSYDNDLKNAKEILKNLYKKGYRDAIQKMRQSNRGGNKTRKKRRKKNKHKRRTFRK